MMESTIPPQRRPALIPKEAVLDHDDIWSICWRTGRAILPEPEPRLAQQIHYSGAETNQPGFDMTVRGTKRKASTTNDLTYESGPTSTHA
jgi:hypothetical protein